MRHATLAAVLAVVAQALTASVAAPRAATRTANRQPSSTGDLVELDVVALDRGGRPVTDLQASDFQIKDDGQRVDVKTFEAVAADGLTSDGARSMVLLLDDSGVPMGGTVVVQAIASNILSRTRQGDEVTVVRLNNERDEPFGDTDTARQRIADYHGGAVPFQVPGTLDRALRVLASVCRSLEAVEHRRKIVVCVGSPAVCNMIEPQPRGYSLLWRPWVAAISAASRANVSVYAAMPIAPGAVLILAGGLADITGGIGFRNTVKFESFVDAMWLEASQYYLLGYWPPAKSSARELHSVEVKVNRKDVRVRARHVR